MKLRRFIPVAVCFCAFAHSAGAATWYVATNGSDSADGTNWFTAKQTIQAAIDVALSNDTVLVSNGVYATGGRVVYGAMTNRVAITNAITVQSVNGPDVTIIEGAGPMGDSAVRCVYVGTNAVLSGFTLTHGATRTSGDFVCEKSGGGTWLETSGTLSNCILTANSAQTYGGGAYGGALNNCTLTGNSAAYGGGANNSTFNNCVLQGNVAYVAGGGAYGGTLNNCILTGNSAEDPGYNLDFVAGGGAYGSTLNNCTLAGNSAEVGGGASGSTLNNCIAYYNTAAYGPNHERCVFNYSCTAPAPGGIGNVTNEPQLVSVSRLAVDSPCIGAGSAVYASGTDIDGEPWLNPPSMGCDEVHIGSITGTLSVSAWANYTNVAEGFPVQFQAETSGRMTAEIWNFDDGTISSNCLYNPLHAFPSSGIYCVSLTVFNEDHPLGVAVTVTVNVAEQTIHYVNAGNATSCAPYTSWEMAATNIQDAVDVASQVGALILVSNGVYATGGRVVYGAMTNRVAITNAITVQSVNGPDVTIIEGAGPMGDSAVRCVYVGTNAVLSGFTLTHGATRASGEGFREQCGGGVWCESSAVLSNCTLTGNSAGAGGGVSFGTINNCTITGNSSVWDGGGTYASALNNCILTGNFSLVYNGGGVSLSTLNNCTLTGNQACNSDTSWGGGALGSVLTDCSLTGNSAEYAGGGAYESILDNCTLTGNTAGLGGGASLCTLNRCTLIDNTATDCGGGASACTLNDCTLIENTAYNVGGGYSGYETVSNCLFVGNTAVYGGGAAAGHLYNCTLISNSAEHGGAYIGYGTLNNCTLLGNSAVQGGGACANPYMSGSQCTLNNCIVYNNTASSSPNHTNCTFNYSCTTPDPGGTGNITNQPRFVATDDFHLSADSPCIDRGNNAYAPGSTDLDGNPRVVHVNVDMGAYESPHGRPLTWYVATNGSDSADGTNWFTAKQTIQAAIDVALSNDTVLVSNGVYATGGRVVYGAMTNRVAITNAITVQSVNGPDVTIIEGAPDPVTTNGDAAVRCVYVGSNAFLTGFTLTHGATRTSGWPYKEDAGGGAWCEPAGVLSNCVLSGNLSGWYGGGSYGGTLNNCILTGNFTTLYGGGAYGGILSNCILTGNSAFYPIDLYPYEEIACGGGASRCTLYNCALVGNTANGGGGGSYDGTLNHCTVTGNRAYNGGGSFYDIVNNCILTGNSANHNGGGAGGSTNNGCIFIGNTASNCGGGCTLAGWGRCTASNCVFIGNTASKGGAAAWGELYSCVLVSNSALVGGACWDVRSLNNCTVVGNSADVAGGVSCDSEGGGWCYLNDSIVYDNTAPSSPNYSNCVFYYSCTMPHPGGIGNITNDPLFVNAAEGNYRLSAASPCIDTGTNTYSPPGWWYALEPGTTDLDGNSRIVHGTVDMGAYEFQGYWAWTMAITNGLTNLADCATGDGYPNLLKYATGSSPTNADNLPHLSCGESDAPFTALFSRNTNAADVTLIVEGTDSLTNGTRWTGIATNFNGSWGGAPNVVEAGTENPLTVKVQDSSIATSRYLRLHVTRP